MLSASPTKKWVYYSPFSNKRKHHLLSYSQISIVSGPKKWKKEVRKLLYLFSYIFSCKEIAAPSKYLYTNAFCK